MSGRPICKILRKSTLAFRISAPESPRIDIYDITFSTIKCTTWFSTYMIRHTKTTHLVNVEQINSGGRAFEGERTLKETQSDSFE